MKGVLSRAASALGLVLAFLSLLTLAALFLISPTPISLYHFDNTTTLIRNTIVDDASNLLFNESFLASSISKNTGKGPDGKYCGSFTMGLVRGELLVRQAQSDLDIHVEGVSNLNTTCEKEKYTFDKKTNEVYVPGATDKADCLGDLLGQGDLKLKVLYAPKTDVIRLDFGFTHVDCKTCE